MRGKCLSIVSVLILLSGPAIIPDPAYAEEAEQNVESLDPGTESMDPLSMESLMKTVSINDTALQAEAKRLGIPEAQTTRYVVRMKAINQDYQNLSLIHI